MSGFHTVCIKFLNRNNSCCISVNLILCMVFIFRIQFQCSITTCRDIVFRVMESKFKFIQFLVLNNIPYRLSNIFSIYLSTRSIINCIFICLLNYSLVQSSSFILCNQVKWICHYILYSIIAHLLNTIIIECHKPFHSRLRNNIIICINRL